MCRGGASTGGFLGIGCGFFLAVALLLSPALMAADLSYRYVEINGVFGESGGEDSTGIGFEGSYDLGGVVFVTAGLSQTDVDTEPESDGEFYRLGLGVRGSLTNSILDETGTLVDLGIRGQIGIAVEYSVLATFVDWADRGWSYRAGGRYQLGDSPYSVGLHYSGYENEWDQLELGLRYQFD